MRHTAYTFPLVSQYHLELDDMAKKKKSNPFFIYFYFLFMIINKIDFFLYKAQLKEN